MAINRFIVYALLIASTLAAAPMAAPDAEAVEKTVVLIVPDMQCASSGIRAERALTELGGVLGVVVDTDEQRVTVTYDDSTVNVEGMKNALEEVDLSVSRVRSEVED